MLSELHTAHKVIGVKPVSYTHLDVYKRQEVIELSEDDDEETAEYTRPMEQAVSGADLSLIHISWANNVRACVE